MIHISLQFDLLLAALLSFLIIEAGCCYLGEECVAEDGFVGGVGEGAFEEVVLEAFGGRVAEAGV